jgi:hypothetical protein
MRGGRCGGAYQKDELGCCGCVGKSGGAGYLQALRLGSKCDSGCERWWWVSVGGLFGGIGLRSGCHAGSGGVDECRDL